jgi:hypothetical protein
MILLHIYLWSAVGACLYFFLGPIIINYRISLLSDRQFEALTSHDDYDFYADRIDSGVMFKMIGVFTPVFNSLLSSLFVFLILLELHFYYHMLGRWLVKRWTRTMRCFVIKEWIIRMLWKARIDEFYDRLDEGPLQEIADAICAKMIAQKKDEIINSPEKSEHGMTWGHAVVAMRFGFRVKHKSFGADEYISMEEEDGAAFYKGSEKISRYFLSGRDCDIPSGWKEGWFIYKKQQ